jgi:hypothetical protein
MGPLPIISSSGRDARKYNNVPRMALSATGTRLGSGSISQIDVVCVRRKMQVAGSKAWPFNRFGEEEPENREHSCPNCLSRGEARYIHLGKDQWPIALCYLRFDDGAARFVGRGFCP